MSRSPQSHALPTPNDATERVLDVAERHFATRGYASVALKEIADDLGLKTASLYYHAPNGKEELYVAVMRRSLERHRAALIAALAGPPRELARRLEQMATWLMAQPPMNVLRMMQSDLPALRARHRRLLQDAVRRCLMAPVERAFSAAADAGLALRHPPRACAGVFWALAQALHAARTVSGVPDAVLAAQAVDFALHGALK